jgi:branched-chain amino acid aminotransferase
MGLIYVNGDLVSEGVAQISVRDHGLVVGDGVFETVLIADRRPFALSRHLARLERSATGLGLPAIDLDEVRRAIDQVTDANPVALGRLRITYTAGLGPLGSGRGDGPAGLVVALDEDHPPTPTSRVTVVPYRRNEHGALVGLKTTSYAENALALAHAAAVGSDEAIFANTAGLLCEGTGSNVFVVVGGAVITPRLSTGCLAGVTRALVLEHSKAIEDDLAIDQFVPGVIEEAFLTSTLRDVQPIAAIDGAAFSEVPGPLTREVAAAFAELRATEIDP